MNNIKILIQATNIHIANCDENIKEERERIKIYKRVIKHAYASCKHNFEEVPSYGANIAKCKTCGFEDGV